MATIQVETVTPPTGQLLVPQASDPATNAAAAQVYAKTDNNLYHKDITGTVSNLLAGQQLSSNALGNNTVAWPYGTFNVTGPAFLNSGASANYLKGIVAPQSGSIVAVSAIGNGGPATGNIVVYKNSSVFFTALTGLSVATGGSIGVPKYATFVNGTYPVAAGDAIDLYTTMNAANLYLGAAVILNFGSINASGLSTPLSANTTVATTDNQRVWVASATSQYTLTLPATQAGQDFYVRVVVTGGAGAVVQAPAGVVIYRGASASVAGGTLTVTQTGAYVTLYNPAGSGLWTVLDPSVPATLA